MQFDISSVNSNPQPPSKPGEITAELLRQILDVQKAILAQMQTTAAAQDTSARWRGLLSRWSQDFPDLPQSCRHVLPTLERAYGTIIVSLVDELRENSANHLENEFNLQDFLDRYGMRLGQMGNILNLVGPLAESAGPSGTPG